MANVNQTSLPENWTIDERIGYFISKWNPAFMFAMHTRMYRLTKGAMGGKMRGIPVLLLTTTGRKTGKQRTKPLMYLPDGENYVIVAANAGASTPPAWWHNLNANPDAIIQVGANQYKVKAEIATEMERNRLWPILARLNPFYEKFQDETERRLDVVVLRMQSTAN